MGHFQDKSAIITGGASGIGRALGEALASQGAIVVLADVNISGAEAAAASIVDSGGRARAVSLDVTDHAAVAALWAQVRAEHGSLDYVFNNAGINVCGELRDHTIELYDRLIDVNIRGVVHGTHEAYAIMREQGHGHIINVASMAGLSPSPMEGAYCATKHAVVGLTQTLRAEAMAFGVDVSVVCPGVIGTPMIDTGTYLAIDKDALMKLVPGGPYPVERLARDVLKGVARNRAIITVTAFAWWTWLLYRIFPQSSARMGQTILRRIRKLRREPGPV